jgi:FkbM family methyltransferase
VFENRLRVNPFLRKIRGLLKAYHQVQLPSDVLNSKLLKFTSPLVFDVGANVGQFGVDLYAAGFKGQMVSFEPGTEAFNGLQRTASKRMGWSTRNLALGSKSGQVQLNVSSNKGLSSSIRPFHHRHSANFPNVNTVRQQMVVISTIKEQIESNFSKQCPHLLKIDSQGFEFDVLIGCDEYLRQIPLIFLEASLRPLYEGECDFLTIHNYLRNEGFTLTNIFAENRDTFGDILQINALFELDCESEVLPPA